MALSLGSSILGIAKVFTVILAVSLALFSYKRVLVPLYGTVPTLNYLNYVYMAALGIPALTPRMSPPIAFLLLGVLLCAAPNLTYWVGVLTGRFGDPVLGPLATHVAVLGPIAYMASSFAMDTNISSHQGEPGLFDRVIVLQAFYSLSTVAADYLWPVVASPGVTDSRILLTAGGCAIAFWTLTFALQVPKNSEKGEPSASPESKPKTGSKTKSKAKKPIEKPVKPTQNEPSTDNTSIFTPRIIVAGVLIPMLPVLLPYFNAPVLPSQLAQPYMHPTQPLRILSSVESTTGRIVVGEILPRDGENDRNTATPTSLRYLRASHSLLGGVWIGNKVMTQNEAVPNYDSYGNPLGDTIYSAFVLQEAARLVSSTPKAKEENWENALVIGLGAGIAGFAFIQHGISTTIVEIDPAVYNASREYFGLPDPGVGKVHLEDARSWVSKRGNEMTQGKKELFDIVVHDCFSGGGVPAHLFTVQFWENLTNIMHPDGVAVVNFFGKLGSEASRSVLLTLQKTFGRCRAFHDSFEEMTEEKMLEEYLNIVFFCTLSSSPLTFRPARTADYLDSYMRQFVLADLSSREVDLGLVLGTVPEPYEQWILTDQNNPLGDWQKPVALKHWRLMRKVLPDYVWETF